MSRIVVWFSCGDASAVATKLILARHAGDEVTIARCVLPEEHPDNERFTEACERWFERSILALRSAEYASCEDVWRRRRYMSGLKGAPCTLEMKRAVRWAFEREWNPNFQAFGYTVEEEDRADRFRKQNPDVRLLTPLIEAGLTKQDCHTIVAKAGIQLPAMYRLGFPNNNCRACVKASSPAYWNLTRKCFPEIFAARATLSRELGCRLVRLTKGDRPRIYLDELTPEMGEREMLPDLECSLLCHSAVDEFGKYDADDMEPF